MQRLSTIESIGNRIEFQLGVPQRSRYVVFRQRRVVGTTVTYENTIIDYAHITKIPSKLLGLFFGNDDAPITVTKDDILVEFPRSAKWDGFLNASGNRTYELLLDATINESVVSGTKTNIIAVLDEDLLCWQLICRLPKDV